MRALFQHPVRNNRRHNTPAPRSFDAADSLREPLAEWGSMGCYIRDTEPINGLLAGLSVRIENADQYRDASTTPAIVNPKAAICAGPQEKPLARLP